MVYISIYTYIIINYHHFIFINIRARSSIIVMLNSVGYTNYNMGNKLNIKLIKYYYRLFSHWLLPRIVPQLLAGVPSQRKTLINQYCSTAVQTSDIICR